MRYEYVSKLYASPTKGRLTDAWASAHVHAVERPREGPEMPIVELVSGWLLYADIHRGIYKSGIGEDQVLGPDWAAIGFSIRGLLNGERGRLDGGTLDSILCDTLNSEGFDPDRP